VSGVWERFEFGGEAVAWGWAEAFEAEGAVAVGAEGDEGS